MKITKEAKVTVEIDVADVEAALKDTDIITMLFVLRRLVNDIRGHGKLAELKRHFGPALREFVDDMAAFVQEAQTQEGST